MHGIKFAAPGFSILEYQLVIVVIISMVEHSVTGINYSTDANYYENL